MKNSFNLFRFLKILIFVFVILASGTVAQRREATVSERSYFEARRILEAAVKAYGGREALRSIENFSVKFEGANFRRNQSRRPEPPYDRTPLSGALVLDVKNGRISHEIISKGVGGFDADLRLVTDGKQGAWLNLFEKTMDKLDNPAFSSWRDRPRWLPHNIVLEALSRAAQTRSLGTATFNNRPQNVVTYAAEDGQQLTLYFDAQTNLMSKFETVFSDIIINETAAETIFPGHITVAEKFKIPTGRVLRRAGEVTEEIAYDFSFNKTLADSLFQIPANFKTNPPMAANQRVLTELAENVYLVRAAAGYNSMFVVFPSYVVVLEAPLNDAAAQVVIDKVKETAPGKPIKYIAVTHHHNDHSGGVRAFVREGANIVTTAGNKNYFTRMVEDVFSPSFSGRAPIARREIIETFQKKRVFSEGGKTLELYDIGPSPHAEEMVVAYLPNERIIFQGDLLNLPDDAEPRESANPTARHFAQWLDKSGLKIEKVVAVHGPAATIDQFRAVLKFVR